MEDRELLELAAKALDDPKLFANTTGAPWQYWIGFCEEMQCDVTRLWNPLEDDGDALRLAVKLSLTLRLNQFDEWTQAFAGDCYARMAPAVSEHIGRSRQGQTIEQATRRAIVRAAAEIGKAMQEKH